MDENNEPKQSFFGKIFGFFRKKSVETASGAVDAVGSVAGKTADMVGGAVDTVGGVAGKAVDTVGGVAGKAVDGVGTVAGKAVNGVGTVAGAAVSGVGTVACAVKNGIGFVADKFVTTARFLTDSKYRREVGYPWLRAVVSDNWAKIRVEIGESNEMMMILWKYSRGVDISDDEKKQARAQLVDIANVVPALAIFLLPGGTILLPILARALNWDMMPSAFKEQVKEEYGEDALNMDLAEDEELPTDSGASELEIPEDLQDVSIEVIEASLQETAGNTEVASSEKTEEDSSENAEETPLEKTDEGSSEKTEEV